MLVGWVCHGVKNNKLQIDNSRRFKCHQGYLLSCYFYAILPSLLIELIVKKELVIVFPKYENLFYFLYSFEVVEKNFNWVTSINPVIGLISLSLSLSLSYCELSRLILSRHSNSVSSCLINELIQIKIYINFVLVQRWLWCFCFYVSFL